MDHAIKLFKFRTLSALIAASLTVPAYATDELIAIDNFVENYFSSESEAEAISGDGSVIVGDSFGDNGLEAFRWSQADGMRGLGALDTGTWFSSSATDVSDDGNVVVGQSYHDGHFDAFRWTAEEGIHSLGYLVDEGTITKAFGTNSDGSVVVGFSHSQIGDTTSKRIEAFYWTTEDREMKGLGFLHGHGVRSDAYAVSSDGSVIVGSSTRKETEGYSNYRQAVRWTKVGGGYDIEGLGMLDGDDESWSVDVSSNGAVVVGTSFNSSEYLGEAFRWTQGEGMAGLGVLPGGEYSMATAVNSDGSVVVGESETDSGDYAFRWTQATGMQTVSQWLIDNGVALSDGVKLTEALDVSADGSIILGFGDLGNGREEDFIARVANVGSGVIGFAEIDKSLYAMSDAVGTSLRTSSLLLTGAHSRPMSHRVSEGQKTFWVAGDWGNDNHNGRDGSIGLAEISGGYHFGFSQINVSVGKTWADQDLANKGDIDADGKYVMLQSIIPVSEANGLYATFGAYGHWGDADIRRGYTVGGGLIDHSFASPDTRTWSVSARLDWENAFEAVDTHFSPYADFRYSDTHMDGYTETGGGFPAQFESHDDEVTEFRVGLNAAMPLSTPTVQLIANIEATHRFDDEAAGVAGEMVGLFAFDLEGRDYDTTWLKGGVGVEGQLGKGKAYLMLNGTTEGEIPSAWLAASYQMTF